MGSTEDPLARWHNYKSTCNSEKDLEDRWILKMGTYFGNSGLNSRDEEKRKPLAARNDHLPCLRGGRGLGG